MKYLFRGGTVVSGRGTRRADILVEGEKILEVGRNITRKADQIIDVTGMLLMPGFIDAHTHFDLDVCNTTTADNFTTGSRAALRGGTTTVVDFACPNKGESLHHGLELWHRKADGRTCCDYGFHMTIDDWNPQIEAEIDDMYAAGISSFKMYMTYPAMMIGDNAMYHALKKLKEKGGICGVHCENSGVIDALIEEKKAAGEMGVSSHPRTRPDFLEAEAVSRLLRIAEAVDIPVVIVHLTNAAALREVEAARKRGQKVYAETCPQYLLLDDSVYDNPDYSLAARYVCAPPIRKAEDQKALWMALRRGEIQTISTDHCSFTLAQKDAGRGDFTKIPGGLPGVETRGELIYTAGVTTRKISLAWHEVRTSVLEGVIARGDRRLGKAIYNAWKMGCKFDSWEEFFDFDKWVKAIADAGLTMEFYASRQRTPDEIFPWDHIDIGVSKAFLRREYEKASRAEVTPNCKEHCAGCGANKLIGGGRCI